MIRRTLGALLRLSRLPSTSAAFLTVFVPTLLHQHNLYHSVSLATPVATTCMCTFMINDLNDVERDRVNHPGRPLPQQAVSPEIVATSAMILLGITLALIRYGPDPGMHFLFLTALILGLNYNTAVDYLPSIKTFYVGIVAVFPVLIASHLEGSGRGPWLPTAVFAFVSGRELLMDFMDLEGDGSTLAARWPKRIPLVAFSFQGASLLTLLPLCTSWVRLAVLAANSFIFLVAVSRWRHEVQRRPALRLMKLQMFSAIVYLL